MADFIPPTLGDLHKQLTKEQLAEVTARAMNRAIVKAENFDAAFDNEVETFVRRLWPHQIRYRKVDRGWQDEDEYEKKGDKSGAE